MRVVMIGPPGAGKGTQSIRLAVHLKIPHLSTGELLRAAKRKGTEIGKIVGPIMDAGNLVSDDLIVGVVKERINQEDCRNGYLLDGFPRTLPQAEAYQEHLRYINQSIDHVIEMRVDDDEIHKRLEARYHQLAKPREDDKPEAIPRRLAAYHSETRPLVDYYAAPEFEGTLKVVDGIGSMDVVFQRILDSIGA